MHAPLYFLVVALSANIAWAAQFEVRVSSPAPSRFAVVSAPVPDDFPVSGVLRSAGAEVPFQKKGSGEVVFILRGLKKDEVRNFQVQAAVSAAKAEANVQSGKVDLLVGGKLVFTYQGTETELPRPDIKPIFKRGGYLHPIFSPSGRLLTDDYPPNHLHHHGIWFPWTKTIFEGRQPDFWNMGDGKGRVEFEKLVGNWSGPVSAGFAARHRFIDLTTGAPKVALQETWNVRAYAVPDADFFVFDLESTQTCASSAPLELPKYLYGGLGFRGNWSWNGENQCFFLTANGETDRVKGNETRANWCHIGGPVSGAVTGIAIFCHPDNFRAPQPMRLHPKEPFFCFAPSQAGDWTIAPGKPYVSRYRFFIRDGQPDKAELDDVWEAYAHPPKATVTKR